MPATLTDGIDETARTLLTEAGGAVLVVDPSERAVEALVDVAVELEDPPTLQLLAEESSMKRVMEDFLVASNAADLVEAGVLEIRTVDVAPGNVYWPPRMR